ncbi:MAG: T9SS type A sorting domain-containing protein [Bacteroidetes bacterium]|nr:T9SS type A sorting domain-containing protein [Bacteroidota bacterium]
MKPTFIIVAFFQFSLLLNAQPGTPDSSFGLNGIVTTKLPNSYLECYASSKQPDGKIILVGYGYVIKKDTSFGFLAMRYTKDGIIDSSFGNDGLTIVYVGPNYLTEQAEAVAVQPDGKIILTGYAAENYPKSNYDIPIIRLNPDGKPDSSFGKNGIVIADYGAGDVGHDVILQPDGKIIVEGASSGYFITLRYLNNGSLDQSFGDGGKVITTFNGLATGTSVALQADGKIVAAGYDESQVLLTRYLPNGITDVSFGTNGEVRNNFTKLSDKTNDMVLQTDGKILIIGNATSFFKDTAFLARYNMDGSLDNSFGINGLSKLPDTSGVARVMLQKDGTIITSGYGFTVSKFNSDGSPDLSFGTNGHTTTPVSESEYNFAYGLCIQDDNKILLTGYTNNNVLEYISLTRYNNSVNQKQIIITKIRRWLQRHNGIMWDNNNSSNISSYTVQRSSDGAHWSTVGRPTANHYNDPSPLNGANYYRLQTTSTDGAVAYSNIIAVTNHEIKISPNPASNILHIEGLSSTNKTKITIIDFAGNIKQQAVASSNDCNVNIASLHPGNYLLKIEMNDGVVIKKFVKE